MIDIYTEGWARAAAADCAAAQHSISVSAISMFPPFRRSEGSFFSLWDAWVQAAARGVTVGFFLPTPQPAHPATLRNSTAARIAHQAGMFTRFVPGPRLLHAKSIVVDARSVWIGSGNMTSAAALTNHEMYVHFESQDVAAKIVAHLDNIANQP